MKPKIYWHSNDDYGLYICQIPDDQYDSEHYDSNWTDEEYYVYMACGAGKTIREAYEAWMRDCER